MLLPPIGPRPRFRHPPSASLALAAVLALCLLPAGRASAAHTYTLTPVADTVIKQASPDSNFGTASTLNLRYTTTNQGQYAFFRFTVPPLAGTVTSATLSLRVTGFIQDASPYAVTMGNPTWAESWLTWNNWAAGSTFTFLGNYPNLAAGSTLNIDVTGWVAAGNVTLAVASNADVAGQAVASREGTVKPKLTIVTSGTLATCGTPGSLLGELYNLYQTGNLLYACDYEKELSPTFGAWSGGSENKPVIAAAIALFRGPTVGTTDYRTWWQDFFAKQAASSGTGHVNYFKGSELFANVYDAATTIGVINARYWGNLNNHTQIRDLAGDYLRRTWYGWALGTSPGSWGAIYRNQGTTRTWIAGAQGQCPTLALASPRSKMNYGDTDSKRWLLAKVLGYNQTCYKLPNHKDIVDYVAAQYSGYSALSSAQVTALNGLINTTTIPSDLATVFGSVRMERDYHFLLWSDGRRATFYTGHQLNNNVDWGSGKHTIFTAMYDRTTRDLDILFVEGQSNYSCLDVASRRVYVNANSPSCSTTHYITLPANPTYHYVLGPTGWRTCTTLGC